ncbi:MAG: peptide-methionine (S)-S-oxide reductase MsrA [Boseongicola sp. SB0675_bin_26]|nr:peptide-methionine (S)-S-oxide reductase MsrA [Boseongicola sp. SB0675_bin_26]
MNTPIPRTILPFALVFFGLFLQGTQAEAEERKAYFAGGCFWCVESDFEALAGVHEVVSGYTGGTTANPTYKAVTKGGTGHYEAVEISYDDSVIGYDQLLHHFFRSVDPTDDGGQFCDRGDSYRTAVFVSNSAERAAAEMAKDEAERDLGRMIVTPVLDASRFYVAEDYHQDYYKSKELVLTRRGPKSKANAYKFYRKACRRDDRVRQLWGDAAPFAG